MTNEISRRSILARATAGAAITALPIASTAALVDPVFAVIAEHRAAVAEYNKAEAISGATVPGKDPEHEAAWEATCAAMDRSDDLLEALLRAQPATIAGAIALLEHLGQDEFLGVDWGGDESDRHTLLSWFSDSAHDCSKRRRLGRDFPLRIAVRLRNLIERGHAGRAGTPAAHG
jgi:hypothetical protein